MARSLAVAVQLGAAFLVVAGCDRGHGIVNLSQTAPNDAHTDPMPGGPRLGAVAMSATIFAKADRRSPKIGYLRAGGTVVRGAEPVTRDDCEGGWYRVLPAGYVCASGEAATDANHP